MTEETHEGLHPAFDYFTTHRGAQENCSSPDCAGRQPIVVPEGWGAYCPHGEHIVVHDPEMLTDLGEPLGRVVEPWPCGKCTLADFKADQARVMEDELDAMADWMRLD